MKTPMPESAPAVGGGLSRLVLAVSRIACGIPEPIGRPLAVAAGWVAARAWLFERERLRETIGRVFHRLGIPLSMPLDRIIDRMFAHFALNLYDLLRYPILTAADLDGRFELHGLEHLEAALARKRGVILAVPHLGNWELLGAAIAHRGYPLHSFYLAQKEDELGGLLDRFRVHSKIVLHDRDRGGMSALKALKRGEILGMIGDQDGGNLGVYMDFLGHWSACRPASPTGASRPGLPSFLCSASGADCPAGMKAGSTPPWMSRRAPIMPGRPLPGRRRSRGGSNA